MVVEIDLVDTGAYHRDDAFEVVLSEPTGGAKIVNNSTEERLDLSSAVAHVKIGACEDRKAKTDELITRLQDHLKKGDAEAEEPAAASITAMEEEESWLDQFKDAVEMPQDGSTLNLVVAFLALPWKIIGAVVPPPAYANGWACFGVTLVFIGVLTAFIGDLASHMGCCMGLEKSVTAITFVALGTSLPDTFASKTAAASEPYADASIINVTGSNSVNVFLGLGLPWMIAAIYWSVKGGEQEAAWRARYADEPWYTPETPVGFAVPAGDLAYSVIIFCITSGTCLATLILRRKVLGFELGGPMHLQWITFVLFVGLWLAYIFLSIAKATQSAVAA